MDLYNEQINEFVNWSTGLNELTESQVTHSNQKISGYSIRNLLMNHLKKPFITYEDTKENKIYFFSSTEAKDLWIQHRDEDNNEKYMKLVLYSMTKPSDYSLELDDSFIGKEHRYVTAGSSGQSDSVFLTSWKIKLGTNTKPDTLEISYEITTGKGRKYSDIIHSSSGAGNIGNISIDTTDYLEEGVNTVTINIWGINTGVTMTIVQYVHVVVFSIESTFDYFKGLDSNKNQFIVPVDLTRNEKKQMASIYVYIDGEQAQVQTAPVNASNDHYDIVIQNPEVQSNGMRKYRSSYIDAITGDVVNVVHNLQIWATTSIGGVEFKTNLLYYTFAVKASDTLESYIVPVATSFPNSIHNGYMSDLHLYGTQYIPISLDWSYFTDILGYDSNIPITWKVSCIKDNLETLRELEINEGKLEGEPKTLSFIPLEYDTDIDALNPGADKLDAIYLCAYGTISTRSGFESIKILSIPMTIEKSTIAIAEPSGYDIELSAYNKNNQSSDKDQWVTTGNIYNVSLHGVQYNSNSGWYDHSLRLYGIDSYAQFNYNPFDLSSSTINSRGLAIEFEFESEKVNSIDDVILTLGDTYEDLSILKSKGVRIEVTPNSATLYSNVNQPIVTTNFKQNERVKLCFIINRTNISSYDRAKVYIVSNGILERAALWEGDLGYDESSVVASLESLARALNPAITLEELLAITDPARSKITIGKSQSGIKFYSLRVWYNSIPYSTAYSNYVYDSEEKSKIFLNNDILIDGLDDVSFQKCIERMNTIIVKETSDTENSHFSDTIFDPGKEKNPSLTNGIILLYSKDTSIDNFTVLNCQFRKHGQSTLKYPIPSLKIWFGKKYNASKNDIPLFTCTAQESLGLNKNRYKMRANSVPANKYILQANYADSSGVHNGGIQRLILRCWYNANIDGLFKLRTPPLLFSSIGVNEKNSYPEALYKGKVWADYFSTPFPYLIRNSADSFPCVLFYETPEGNKNYIGQYVFMDDKKSDFTYGERSIYKAAADDPFCLKTINKDKDTDDNLIWDNKDVLRIEVLDINDLFTSYMTFQKEGVQFDAVIEEVNEETGEVILKFKWEQNFELIYPDPDDVETENVNGVQTYTKFNNNSKFRRVTQPFVNWVKWLTDTRNHYNEDTLWWDAGQYSTALEAFNATASDHLDLWKMAAYYVFMLRFALTDSGERNVQIKTYDGVHFHYEPWDMDIALGNKNDGGIAFNPPVDRTTQLGDGSYAISGKSASTSNWLWDALEGNTTWVNTIVPKVADALYNAGLTYENCILMLDGEYSDKWNETIYNKSGYFKYIEKSQDQEQYLRWLQGARKLHRHWWLNTSMNFYDAKWGCGTFKSKAITFYAGHTAGNEEENIIIKSSTPTYVSMEINQGETKLGTKRLDANTIAAYNIGNRAMNYKVPADIYGALNIEYLDFSCIGGTFNRIQFDNAYDSEAGAKIKYLNIGVRLTDTDNPNVKTGPCNVANDGGITGNIALLALEVLNIRGQRGGLNPNSYVNFQLLRSQQNELLDLVNIKEFYGMGANIVLFYSSYRGNNFDILELPSSIEELDLRNTTWNTIEFWDAEIGTVANLPEEEDDPEVTYLPPGTAIYTKHSTNSDYTLNIPDTLTTVRFNGTTGQTEKSKEFILGWINSIIASLGDNPTEAQINIALGSKKLYMDSVSWTSGEGRTLLTYLELKLIAKMQHHLSGYILLASDPNNPLQSEDLNDIKTWFGNDVFSKSSGGIIIDYNLNRTIVSVGGPTGGFYIDEHNVPCVKEGSYCTLDATQFLLRADSTEYVWKLRAPHTNNAGKDTYLGCKIGIRGRNVVMFANESAFTENYEVEAFTTLSDYSTASIIIKVIVSSYPTLTLNKTSSSPARISGNAVALDDYGSYADLFIVSSGESTVRILDIQYSILNCQTGVSTYLGFTTNLSTDYILIDENIKYRKSSVVEDGIEIYSQLQRGEIAIHKYILLCTVRFSARTITLLKDIYVGNDSLYIIDTATASTLAIALGNLYDSLYGNSAIRYLYKIDLLLLTGSLDLSSDSALTDITTELGDSIFKYLPNISEVNLSGCSQLPTMQGDQVLLNLLDFSNMTSLRVLNIEGCTSISNDIDLTHCPNIEQVNAVGTTINILIPLNTKLTKYYVGKPTLINIDSPTVLKPSGIYVRNPNNLTSLYLKNICSETGDSKIGSFTAFDRITQFGVDINEFTLNTDSDRYEYDVDLTGIRLIRFNIEPTNYGLRCDWYNNSTYQDFSNVNSFYNTYSVGSSNKARLGLAGWGSLPTFLEIVDTDTNNILFKFINDSV